MQGNFSYTSAPKLKHYVYKTHMQMIQHWAKIYPDKEAFVEYDENGKRNVITCQEVLEKSKSVGWYVAGLGVQKGDTVAICMKNSLSMLALLFGVQFAGCIPISIMQSRADGSDVLNTIWDNKVKLLIIDMKEEQNWASPKNIQLLNGAGYLTNIIYNDQADLINFNLKENITYIIDLATVSEVQLPDIYPEDLAVYFTTSGSTGKPKLVGHSHFGLFNSTFPINDCMGINSQSRFFCDRPFGWGVGSPRTFLASGATRIFVDTGLSLHKNNIDILSNIIFKERCTHVYLPGYLLADLINSHVNKENFSAVQTIKVSGERFLKPYIKLLGQYCRKLVIWYGSTEAAGVSAFSSTNACDYEEGIIGKPLPGNEMKLVDEQGHVVPIGEIGEIYARSVYRFIQYKNMQDKFLDTVDEANWIRMGDMAYIRADGNFISIGRKNDQMSVGSVKIFPQEVEESLITCPEITAVIAVPVPDKRLYHAICACVVLSKTVSIDTNDIQKLCDNLFADKSQLKPKYYIVFQEFPKNASGKIDRKEIARVAAAKLNM